MAQAVQATDIYARIGDVGSGSQVAVGHHIVQIGDVKGGIVYVQREDPQPPRARPHPVSLRPRPFPGLLDRGTETSESIRALASNESLECTGEPGSGKTSFLRYLAHQPQISSFSAGVIYSQVNHQSNADLLKSLFDAFYEYDSPIKPTDTEIRHYLQNFKALILLDDVDSTGEQIQQLMNIAPNCAFITATSQRSLFGEAREVALKGLPTADAISLFERELGRTLSTEERNAAEHICELVGCNPQRIMRAANQARDEKRSLVDIVPPDPSVPLDQVLAAAEIESRSEDEKKVLSALAVFYGAPVAAQHVGAVAEVSGVERILDDFERRGLIYSHDKQYTLSSDLKNALPGNLTSLRVRALSHFVEWVEKQPGNPEAITKSAQPILLILKWGSSAKFWPEVARLGHGTEEALTLSGKWDMWGASLESILESARAEQNRAEEAWALHQLGTRALCLGATSEAKGALTSALALREALNDQRGAAATRHNLNILLGPAPPTDSDGPGREPGPGGISPLIKFGVPSLAGAGLLAVLLFGPWLRVGNDDSVGDVDVPPPQSPPTAPSAIPAPPPALPQVLSFSASPPGIVAGESSQLCFQLQDASSVAIDGGIPSLQAGTGRQCVSVAPEATTTYRLTASNSEGQTSTSETTVTVSKPAPQITGFTARPNSLTDEGSVALCYNVLNGDGLEIDNGVGRIKPTSEGCVATTVKETTTFTLTATGSEGRVVTRQARVDVAHPDIALEFTAEPSTITRPNAATLCYQASGAITLSIDHDVGRVPMPSPGERACTAVRPSETTTYTLSAVGSFNRTANRQLTVSVNAPPKHARIIDFRASKQRVTAGEPVQLCYEIADAERASLAPISKQIPTGSNCISNSPKARTRYVLTAVGEDGQPETREQIVELAEPERAPPVRITKFEIDTGDGRSQLCYAVENAVSARIEPFVGAVRLPGDCRTIRLTKPTTLTLTASDASGRSDRRRAEYRPPEPPKESIRIRFFSALPRTIFAGDTARICYATVGEGTASISPDVGNVRPSPRMCVKVTPKITTIYTMRAGQDQPRTVKITVNSPVE
ncbi:MAG TPA: AAA family ATPase [Gemmatimonadaceae bacterium]|nr:AAA family ATPase [Gemmatimonadaceae bacterium]